MGKQIKKQHQKKTKKNKFMRICTRCGNAVFSRYTIYKCTYCGEINGLCDVAKSTTSSR